MEKQLQIFQMEMPQLNRAKTIRVFLPKDYEQHIEKRYGVLYMHDGQNLFDIETAGYGASWEVGETLNKLQDNKEIDGYIVVGMDNNNDDPEEKRRLDEYSPWENRQLKQQIDWEPPISKVAGGEGAQYVDFIVQTLKPYIDATYRTKADRTHTIIAGSSMGGFISLYAAFKYPEVFSKVGSFSTAIWFEKEQLFHFIKENFGTLPLRIYMDIGTKEVTGPEGRNFESVYLNDSMALEQLLKGLGQPKEQLLHVIEEGATHYETAWARRFPDFIRWIQQ
ncbi:MAG: alpha/beta hydrolase [Bacillaceae bacterium]